MKRMMKLVVGGLLGAAVLSPVAVAAEDKAQVFECEFKYRSNPDEALRKMAETSEYGLPVWQKGGKIFMWVKVDGKPTWKEFPETYTEGELVRVKGAFLDETGLRIRLEFNGKSLGELTLNKPAVKPASVNPEDLDCEFIQVNPKGRILK